MRRSRRVIAVLSVIVAAICLSAKAISAYGGPGSVVTGIGALLAAVAALFAALFGFIWFPVKKLIRKFTSNRKEEAPKAKDS